MMRNWRKFILSAVLGNILELYDFILYGFFSYLIAQHFFTPVSPHVSLILTFTVFAFGCFMRPVGSILFGYLGDTYGRRFALIISMIIMIASTTSIGLIPTYNNIGLLAPLLLVIARLTQGLSLCGEEIGAALLLMENAPTNRQSLAGSLVLGSVYLGLMFGAIIFLLVNMIFTPKELVNWAWRLPFLLALPLGGIALWLRVKQPEWRPAQINDELEKNKLLSTLKFYRRSIFNTFLLSAMLAASVYIYAVYVPNKLSAKFSMSVVMSVCSLSFLLTFFYSLFIGFLGDYIRVNKLARICCYQFIFLSFPLFILLSQNSIYSLVIAQFILVILVGTAAGSLMPLLTSLFPSYIRYTGVGIGFNVSMTLFGSTAPLISLYISGSKDNPYPLTIYVMLIACVTLYALNQNDKQHVVQNKFPDYQEVV